MDGAPCPQNRTSLQEAVDCGSCQCGKYSSQFHTYRVTGMLSTHVEYLYLLTMELEKKGGICVERG